MNEYLGTGLLDCFHVGTDGGYLGFMGVLGHGLVHVSEMLQYLGERGGSESEDREMRVG